MKFENTLQYVTFADRTQVEYRVDCYDSLLLSSHLVTGGKKAVTTLLQKLVTEKDVEYYINPSSTHFRRGSNFRKSNGDIKQWHSKLISELGEPFERLKDRDDNLRYEDLTDEDFNEAAQSVCEFQEEFVPEVVEENAGKYVSVDTDLLSPKAVIPLYTKIRDYPDINVNKESISVAKDTTGLPIKPCIHVTKEYLGDINFRNNLIDLVSDERVGQCFLWVDNLDRDTKTEEYKDVIDLVSELHESGVETQFMFGNFFSNLLYYFGLNGTSYGTYYRDKSSEKTADTSGGGGGSLQRFYYDPVKEFLSIPDAIALGIKHDEEIPSFTPMNSWEDLYKEGDDHDFLKNHYIFSRNAHKRKVNQNELEDVLEELLKDYNKYSKDLMRRESVKDAEHIKRWVESIQEYVKENPDKEKNIVQNIEKADKKV